MNLLQTLTQIGKDIKALIAKDSEIQAKQANIESAQNLLKEKDTALEQKINALESKGIDQSTLDNLKNSIKAEAKAEIKSEIIDGAPEALDTLKEISDQLTQDKSASAALADAVAKRLRFDEAQTLSTEQKQQAAANLGIDDPTVDYLALYNQAKTQE